MSRTAVVTLAPPLPFEARGPLSSAVLRAVTGSTDSDIVDRARDAISASPDVLRDDDVQLALFTLYAAAYRSVPEIRADAERDPQLISARHLLEEACESQLREHILVPETPAPTADAVARALFDLTAPTPGPSLARYVAKSATADQVRELLVHRSLYTLREADPHSWAIPRLTGRSKAALVEIQADEYGGGRPERMHSVMFANAMRGAGLDDTYGAYVDRVPALGLAALNAISLLGLDARLVGAVVGHLAAFEMTSSLPSKMYADGLRRLGFDASVSDYFDEHVEADAVHEQIAGRDLAGGLAEDEPDLVADIMFGAAVCVTLDEWSGAEIMEAWSAGESSLREGGPL
ncbi:iron-containing redox enzyme family protein [Demequina sp. TTPB684]|uniref:iron-containing redox enzyme family protein n=1 Tax=unclassified Demequina TaxID=2620311 RepID=UPI001CF17103|nr:MULTISPECIES: iron-containing redox enzyme family protein [unclassified Demequina]MCB2412251.1 iron-containing redox enzyme family protein [Demequina sp. TTPB684]UPU87110.1 iron-containing redox enzyme family protein [Demequina sp. TMPB413]